MSETPETKPAEKPAGGKSSKIIPILLVLNLGASGFSTFKLATATAQPAAAAHVESTTPTTSEVTGPVVALEPFVVNLDEPGQSRYVKVTLQVELVGKDDEKVLEKSKLAIRDMILSHLSGLKLADTLGAAAKDKLRIDLMAKLEVIVGAHKVRRMFFQEFVVQ
jgi:flagellar FliL protein